MHPSWRIGLAALPLFLGCSTETRDFSSSSSSTAAGTGGHSSASHMGGSPATGTNSGAGGSGTGATGPGGSGGSGGSITQAEACAEYAGDFCAKYDACDPGALIDFFNDVGTCKEREKILCLDYIGATNTSWSPKAYAACGTALSHASCPAFLLSLVGGPPPDACKAKPGSTDDGQRCIDSGQCKSAYCKRGREQSCGICVTPGTAGTPCSTVNDCQAGLACASNICSVAKQDGEACDTTHDDVCAVGSACQDGACGKTLGKHVTCLPGRFVCDGVDDLYCNTATDKCEPFAHSQPGQACPVVSPPDGGIASIAICAGGGRCDGNPGACIPSVLEGQSCASNPCMFPALCQPGTNLCVLPKCN